MQCKSIDDDIKYGRYNKRAHQIRRTLTKTSPIIIEDNNGKPLAHETKILNRWTKYCNDLYYNPINPDTNVLSNTAIFNEESDTE